MHDWKPEHRHLAFAAGATAGLLLLGWLVWPAFPEPPAGGGGGLVAARRSDGLTPQEPPSQNPGAVMPSDNTKATPAEAPQQIPVLTTNVETRPRAQGAQRADKAARDAWPAGRDFYKDAEVIAQTEFPAAPDGTLQRRKIVKLKQQAKYPLVRLEETVAKTPGANPPPGVGNRAQEQEKLTRRLEMVADHIIVKLKPGMQEAALLALNEKHGDSIRQKLNVPGLYLVAIPAKDAEALPRAIEKYEQEAAMVAYAEPDYIVRALDTETIPNDPGFPNLWGMKNTGQGGGTVGADIRAPAAWSLTTGSQNVKVAVIDSGIDYTHPDLAANVDSAHGWNFVNNTSNAMDDFFHGTHVAGTIGAVGNNGQGVVGVCWQVTVIPVKFLNADGAGTTADAVQSVTYATNQHVNIMSNSWGGGDFSQSLKDAIDAANAAGILFVTAAGNDSSNNDTVPSYPASYACPNIIAVAATDSNDSLAGFSNYGVTSVHMGAPGVNIYSTLPLTSTAAMFTYGLPTAYGFLNGTSMATAHVSGAAALLKSYQPSLTVQQLKDQLLQRADPVLGLAGRVDSCRRLNVYGALNPNWVPQPARLALYSVTDSDIEGNNDGCCNPGEIIELSPMFANIGQQTSTGGTITAFPAGANVSILTSWVSLDSLPPGGIAQSAVPLRVQIAPSATDGQEASVSLQVASNGSPQVPLVYTMSVFAPLPQCRIPTDFDIGALCADPFRNVVYVIDKTTPAVRAFSTDTGVIVAQAQLADPPAGSATRSLTVSQDGSTLFVCLPIAQAIQIFALPGLVSQGLLSYDFPPGDIVAGAGNRLYVTYGTGWGKLRQIDAATGAVLSQFAGTPADAYYYALLRTNQAGTHLYAGEAGQSVVGGPGYIYEYDISGTGSPTMIAEYPYTEADMEDFSLDEADPRLLIVCTGVNAIQIEELGSQNSSSWPLGSEYGFGICHTQDAPFLYVSAQAPGIGAGNVYKYRKSDGKRVGQYSTQDRVNLLPESLKITPNGHMMYAANLWRADGKGFNGFNLYLECIGFVAPNATPFITSALNATAALGKAFSYTITASGSPTAYSADPLPDGLALNTGTGVISGTPTWARTFPVLVSASNSFGTGEAWIVIVVKNTAPVITSPNTASGIPGTAFAYLITASNTPASYSATPLPAGVSVNPSTGAVTGVPTVPGTTKVTLSATNASGTGSATLFITIGPPPPPVITSATTANGTVGAGFSYQITASNNAASYNATPLPAGLSVNTSTGAITGTPTAAGTSSVTISATNAGGSGSATLSIIVAPVPPPPVITSATTAGGNVGQAFSYNITATNTPTGYDATPLPAGLSVNTTTGAITGTPTAAGTASVTISATNSGGSGSATLSITIASPLPPVISSATVASATVGTAFNYQITASNDPTSYDATPLPPGLSVNSSTGAITGAPTAVGTTSVAISATNAGGTGAAVLTITVTTPLTIATLAGLAGSVGSTDGTSSTARFYRPQGAAVDNSGNIYVADTRNHTIRKIAPSGLVSTFAGLAGSSGSTDGTGNAARFYCPCGTAVDSSGNVYVADQANCTIRKISPAGAVSTLAGTAGSAGSSDGTGSAARFNYPSAVAVDGSSNVYVADTCNSTIRLITPGGAVSTWAGSAGATGSADGTGSAARFCHPGAVAVDNSGNVLVADTWNNTIRLIASGAVVSTLAGLAGSSGSVDGTGSAARFNCPCGVAVDGSGNLFVSDFYNHAIRKVTPAGAVSTPAGYPGVSGSTDGTGSAARFYQPSGLAMDSAGCLYVCDMNNDTIRCSVVVAPAITSATTASGYVGQPFSYSISASNFPTSYNATPLPAGLLINTSTGAITGTPATAGTTSVTISATNFLGTGSAVLSLTIAALPTPVITSATTASGTVGAAFSYQITASGMPTSYNATPLPAGLSVNTGTGAITGLPMAAGTTNVTISATNSKGTGSAALAITVDPAMTIITLAGFAGVSGSSDGTGITARFNHSQGVAVSNLSIAYVADTSNHTIRKVGPTGVVTTFAGLAGSSGSTNGTGSAARFYSPCGVAVDSSGNVYVADTNNHTIRKITSGGVVSTLAGQPGSIGTTDGTGSSARFHSPYGLTVDASGNVYVADQYNNAIRKVTSAGVVTTFAGTAGASGSTDGTGNAARFYGPSSISMDGSGNFYVADAWNHTIRKITSGAVVTTVAGLAGSSGATDGTGNAARFYYPYGVASDSSGNLFVADKNNHTIRKITTGGAVSTMAGLAGTTGSADGIGSAARFNSPCGLALDSAGHVYIADTYNYTIRLSPGPPVITSATSAAGYVSVNGTYLSLRPRASRRLQSWRGFCSQP